MRVSLGNANVLQKDVKVSDSLWLSCQDIWRVGPDSGVPRHVHLPSSVSGLICMLYCGPETSPPLYHKLNNCRTAFTLLAMAYPGCPILLLMGTFLAGKKRLGVR